MAHSHLATYLNDHLAGSEAALNLLQHLEREHQETDLASFATELRLEIEEDRRELESLMGQIPVVQSLPRKASGWLAHKLADLKLRFDDLGDGPLRLLEIFEALSLGIEGKHGLWRALEEASGVNMELRVVDYDNLKKRAEGQRSRVEVLRLKAAQAAFGSPKVAEKG